MKTENFNRQIVKSVSQFFFIWDLIDHQIIYLTRGFRDYTHVKHIEQSEYHMMLDFVHPDQRADFEETLKNFSADQPYQDRDFKVNEEIYPARWFNLRSFPIQDKSGTVIRLVAHISDVTKRKEELARLEDLNEKNESIIRILAHDLKTPINQILALSELAEKDFQQGKPEDGYAMIRLIQEAGKSMDRLTISMLEQLELTHVRLSAKKQWVDLSSMAKEVMQHMAFQFGQHNIKLVQQWTEEPHLAYLDVQKFPHIITNLLSNALKFTPDGGTVTVRIDKDQEHLLLAVSDTGVGIPTDKQPDVFKEFVKVRKRGLRDEKSTGLGLSIVKKITDLHHGSVTVDSTLGIGSTFLVKIPQYQPDSGELDRLEELSA